jgi:nucleotide-binding universal stress UspA family protein
VSEGKPFKVINQVAKDNKCDTIVMGTNGANGIEQFTGSTTSRVIKSSAIPVIAVKEKRTEPKFNKIVLPIDLTKTSKQKIDWAVKVGLKYNSTIHIIMELEKDELIERKIKANLKQAEGIFEKYGVKHKSHLLDDREYPDNLGKDTIKYAEEIDADLIMIMTKSETGKLSELFVGSYAEQIVNSSQKTPVMCINPKPTGSIATGGSGFY